MSKYFTADLKPDYVASLLQAGAISAEQVLFDWTPVQVPKGTICLKSVTALVRPKADSTPSLNNFAFTLYFSKSNTNSIGTVNSNCDHTPNNDYLGVFEMPVGAYGGTGLNGTVVATSIGGGGDGELAATPLIMTPTETARAGFNNVYVAATSGANFDFRSINTIETTEAASATIHCDGTSMDLRQMFLPGDVLHTATTVGAAAADTFIGTVKTVDSATNITLTDTAAVTHVDGTIIMNINPIRIILGFEQ